jgi:hypothetical protein
MTHTEKYNVQLLASFQARQVELYKQHLEGKFDWSTMSLYMVKEVYEHNLQDVFVVPFYIDWLLENKDNTLPFTSSSSFLTALTDIDNFMAAVVNLIDRELTDDEVETAESIFLEKMAK